MPGTADTSEDAKRVSGKPVLLYTFPSSSSFIQRDLDALNAHFDVRAHELLKGPRWLLPIRLLAQLIWALANRMWERDVICHFSGYHAVLPTLLAKRSFVILAGSDCASIPAIGYGDHTRRMKGWASRYAAEHATRLLPVHASLIARNARYSTTVPEKQGIAAFSPGLKTPFTVVPYGFDGETWYPAVGAQRDPALFVCVCGPAAPGNRVHHVKGIDLIVRLAGLLPNARFLLVGLADVHAYTGAPPNLQTVGRVSGNELRAILSEASFYIQPSLSEGMPNALCEAMLCGCVPVVSDVASMPDIVGACGAVLLHEDAALAAKACEKLLALSTGEREAISLQCRERIATTYAMATRVKGLLDALQRDMSAAPR
ncbi:MAG: glycosyltransferase family 4 protein [Flavobacteriales bacterium]